MSRAPHLYGLSSSSYLHASRQLVSHLDWREPIGFQERLEWRSSHNGEFLCDVSWKLEKEPGFPVVDGANAQTAVSLAGALLLLSLFWFQQISSSECR